MISTRSQPRIKEISFASLDIFVSKKNANFAPPLKKKVLFGVLMILFNHVYPVFVATTLVFTPLSSKVSAFLLCSISIRLEGTLYWMKPGITLRNALGTWKS